MYMYMLCPSYVYTSVQLYYVYNIYIYILEIVQLISVCIVRNNLYIE